MLHSVLMNLFYHCLETLILRYNIDNQSKFVICVRRMLWKFKMTSQCFGRSYICKTKQYKLNSHSKWLCPSISNPFVILLAPTHYCFWWEEIQFTPHSMASPSSHFLCSSLQSLSTALPRDWVLPWLCHYFNSMILVQALNHFDSVTTCKWMVFTR